MSLVLRKPDFCICENKDADQLRGNREADQRLCFRYTDSTIPLLSKSENFKPLTIFCGCTARFVWDLVENPEDRFSQNEAHITYRPGQFQTFQELRRLDLSWNQYFTPGNDSITKTSPCNEHPLTPHFYIVKLGFTGVYIIFLFLL